MNFIHILEARLAVGLVRKASKSTKDKRVVSCGIPHQPPGARRYWHRYRQCAPNSQFLLVVTSTSTNLPGTTTRTPVLNLHLMNAGC